MLTFTLAGSHMLNVKERVGCCAKHSSGISHLSLWQKTCVTHLTNGTKITLMINELFFIFKAY